MSDSEPDLPDSQPPTRKNTSRANQLEGKQWLRNSISVWDDLRKTPAELKLKHPAAFPIALAGRLIDSFLPPQGRTILDPFAGIGSTLVAAAERGLDAIGSDLSAEYCEIARSRLADFAPATTTRTQPVRGDGLQGHPGLDQIDLRHTSAQDLLATLSPGSIDLCITSPPYWDVLNARRTADAKPIRHYGNLARDLGTITDYEQFLDELQAVFASLLTVLKPGAYCCVVVMDLRKKDRFYPFHSDLAGRLTRIGYLWDDLIIWNRQAEYNNLRPLGYPAVFRINKVHEFVVVLQKARLKSKPAPTSARMKKSPTKSPTPKNSIRKNPAPQKPEPPSPSPK